MIANNEKTQPAELELSDIQLYAGEKCLLSQQELKIPAGKICLLLGPSGVGKSLLLRLIAGLIPSGVHHSTRKECLVDR